MDDVEMNMRMDDDDDDVFLLASVNERRMAFDLVCHME